MMKRIFIFLFLIFSNISFAAIDLGVDVFFKTSYPTLKNKRLALIVNHTSVDKDLKNTLDLFLEDENYNVVSLFSPEHGVNGSFHAGDKIDHTKFQDIKVFSLHGQTKRPNSEMLKNVDAIVYDIQEIGCRGYTYATTLFYVMEEAAKKKIKVLVLDRPNPINGLITDGPMLDDEMRSFLGYINVPYCHGMTIGELAMFFNGEYKIGCDLKVVQMNGWKREMSYEDTGLYWIPTSPHIPEPDSPFYCASTGIIGELELVNIGIGYTMPFKVIGASWINGRDFAKQLNKQNLKGVRFIPFYYKPYYGAYKGKNLEGVKIVITDRKKYRPLAVQYLLIGMLKSLYPEKVEAKLNTISQQKIDAFCKVNGNKKIFDILKNEKYAAWKMIQFEEDKVKAFLEVKKRYELY